MSHHRRRRRDRPEALPEGALDDLERALADIANPSIPAFHRLSGRLALTYRPCRRWVEAMPAERVPLGEFRMLALSHRWVERQGRVARRVVLGIYRAEVDLPGSGRIRLVCDGVISVGHRGGRPAPDPRSNPTAARAVVLLAEAAQNADEPDLAGVALPRFDYAWDRLPVPEPAIAPADWAAAATRIGDRPAWPAEFFARPSATRWECHPLDGSPDPWAGAGGAGAEEGAVRGTWVLRDGVATPMAQRPAAVYADFSAMAPRVVRSPAYRALAGLGVIRGPSYPEWREGLSPATGGGQRKPVDLGKAGAGGRFLADLDRWVQADPGHAEILFRGLRDSCAASGVPVPADPEEADGFLAGLAESPWAPVEAAGAPIQLIRLADFAGSPVMSFASKAVELDMADLGPLTEYFEPLPGRRVREWLAGRWAGAGPGRERRPRQGSAR